MEREQRQTCCMPKTTQSHDPKATWTQRQYAVRIARPAQVIVPLAVLGTFVLSLLFFSDTITDYAHAQCFSSIHSFSKNAISVGPSLLNVFQVHPPVLVPTSQNRATFHGSDNQDTFDFTTASICTKRTLVKHVFANSYNKPFVGVVNPPDCNFNRVVLNATFTAAGRQFDRLGSVYFGDIEIWRFSTAEPTQSGIVFSYEKDMTHLLSLFNTQQKLIFDLGNLVNDIYTSPFNVTLTATYFSDDSTVVPADRIIPLSAHRSAQNAASAFQVPDEQAMNTISLPRNIRKAVFSLAATGQIDEEFWFGNVFSSQVDTFSKSGTDLLGYSPFREVQLYIDDLLAGVAWPFPIIFTGGVVPGLWRPVVGIDVFDIREDEIDITPWLPKLCDGRSHTFQIRIASIDDDGSNHGAISNDIGNYWVVSGKLFIWLDPPGFVTSGSKFVYNAPAPAITISSSIGKTAKGANRTLIYDTDVTRSLYISSTIRTAKRTESVSWKQSLRYHNKGEFTKYGNVQATTQTTKGHDSSSKSYDRQVEYPVEVNTTYSMNKKNGDFSIDATLNRGQNIAIKGQPTFPTGLQSFEDMPSMITYPKFQGTNLQTTQSGKASYFATGDNKVIRSSGETTQDMEFRGVRQSRKGGSKPAESSELYRRHVFAANNTVRQDNESLVGKPIHEISEAAAGSGSTQDFAGRSLFRMIGRGPRPEKVGGRAEMS